MKYVQVKSAESSAVITIFLNHIVYITAEPEWETTKVQLTNGEPIIIDMPYSRFLNLVRSESRDPLI